MHAACPICPPLRRYPPSSQPRAMRCWAWTPHWASSASRRCWRNLSPLPSSPLSCQSGRAREWPCEAASAGARSVPTVAGGVRQGTIARKPNTRVRSRTTLLGIPLHPLSHSRAPCPAPMSAVLWLRRRPQVLRHPQPSLRRQVPHHRQVVLQRPRDGHRLVHRHAPGQGQGKRPGWGARRTRLAAKQAEADSGDVSPRGRAAAVDARGSRRW